MNEPLFWLDLIVEKETTETPFVLDFCGGNTDEAGAPPPPTFLALTMAGNI